MFQLFTWLKATTLAVFILTCIVFLPILITGIGVILSITVLTWICKQILDEDTPNLPK